MITQPSNSETFRRLVDNTSEPTSDEIDGLYSTYTGVSTTTLNIVSDVHVQIISASLDAERGLNWHELRSLKRDLIIDSTLFNYSLEPYFSILSVIQDAVRENNWSYSLSERERWSHAIKAARAYYEHAPNTYFVDEARLRRHYKREYNLAEAAKRLSLAGFEIVCGNGCISISEEQLKRIAETIEILRTQIDGRVFGKLFFNSYSQHMMIISVVILLVAS